ncbi:hypothetical protein B0O99DRAFT_623287 [Bisporella sp. PMI_857]|nr:hypothetical protein B0O99DRAFT_623287 [Bisporella sp. PMI_857]
MAIFSNITPPSTQPSCFTFERVIKTASNIAYDRIFILCSKALVSFSQASSTWSGSLTVMNKNSLTDIFLPNTPDYERKQFWNFRWEVQRAPTLSERAQQEISSRLTTLRHMTRLDALAIHETRIRRLVKELIERSRTLRCDRRRLRKRSKQLFRRLDGTIQAYRRHRHDVER